MALRCEPPEVRSGLKCLCSWSGGICECTTKTCRKEKSPGKVAKTRDARNWNWKEGYGLEPWA
jgi:hypothetical protein